MKLSKTTSDGYVYVKGMILTFENNRLQMLAGQTCYYKVHMNLKLTSMCF